MYTPRLEALIKERNALLKAPAHRPEPERQSPADDGMNALERFGAELEAILIGEPAPVAERAGKVASPPTAGTGAAAPAPRVLASIEAELNDLLMAEGHVVRGHDVARVVALMAGKQVEWAGTTG